MIPRLVCHALSAAAFTATLAAQSPSFRTETRLVVVHATVTNSRGEARMDLDQSAFTVFENGRRQSIALFRRDDIPVSLGVLLDNSGSMKPIRARVEAAALAFVRASNHDDEVFVVNFADHPKLSVPMTRDVAALEAGIAQADAIGGTALRDAVHFAQRYVDEHAAWDRRALLIVTDGKDNASGATMKEIQQDAEHGDTTVFGVGLFARDDRRNSDGRKELDEITARTGGTAYYPPDVEHVEAAAVAIARQIRQQYTIGYSPGNPALDGTYRAIEVKATPRNGSERLTVRTRAGYRAETGRNPTRDPRTPR
jgi:Ca-activated chloride channel homolog